MTDNPWCLCSRSRTEGYVNLGNGIWGHQLCRKPTRLFWINKVLRENYERELDAILTRIIEHTELEDGLDKGRAETACKFIAMILNPVNPSPLNVKNAAVKRYLYRKNNAVTKG
jgi:hypothetical protein